MDADCCVWIHFGRRSALFALDTKPLAYADDAAPSARKKTSIDEADDYK